jgi:uncharacterized protein YbjQ (UPF0145 family)
MLITTTPQIEGKRITSYLGIVSGEAIMGADIFKDLFAGIRNIVGGRAAAYESELRRAKEIAIAEMAENAKTLGAAAVVGVDLDYETLGQGGNMLMVSASGILWIVYGLMGLLFAFFAFLVLFGVSFIPDMGDIAPGILRLIAWVSSLFFLALAVPQIIAGLGLLKRKEWARLLTLIVSFFHLISFPMGTALSIYSFVTLLKPEAVKLFSPSP